MGDYRAYTATVSGRARKLFLSARSRAAKGALSFDLTFEWVRDKVETRHCALCSRRFDLLADSRGEKNPLSPSIDRIEPGNAYTQTNCRVICWDCNLLKRDRSDAHLFALIHGIITTHPAPQQPTTHAVHYVKSIKGEKGGSSSDYLKAAAAQPIQREMHRPPKLWSAHLDDLVTGCGGSAAVCKLLNVHVKTLKRWQSGGTVPRMALELLWYAGPYGAAAAQDEYGFTSQLDRTISDARQREIDRLKDLLRAYEVNGAPVVPQPVQAVNDEYGALPPQPPQRSARYK